MCEIIRRTFFEKLNETMIKIVLTVLAYDAKRWILTELGTDINFA